MYDYIRNYYGVNPVAGERVRFNEGRERPEGTIRNEDKTCSHYVMVQFDNVRWPAPCHPTSLDYLGPAQGMQLREAGTAEGEALQPGQAQA